MSKRVAAGHVVPMKIVFLIRSLERSGAERQLVLLAREIYKKGYSVSVVVFYDKGPLEDELLKSGVPVFSLHKSGRWDLIKFTARFLYRIKMEKPDILYSFLTTANLLALLVRGFFPRVKVIWGLRASHMDLKYYDGFSNLTSFFENKIAFLPHRVIANSYAGAQYATQVGFPKKRIRIVHNGIDINRFYPDTQAGRAHREAMGFLEGELLIGMIARLDPMKDYPTFFEAAAILSHHHPNIRFLCMGRGNEAYRETLKQRIADLNMSTRLMLIDERSDVENIYHALDILCLTSAFGEGFSNVLGEAMACGVPCVATDVGDAALIIGELGKIVPIQAPLQVATACEDIMKQRIPQHLIRQRIVDNFSTEATTDSTERVFRELIPMR